MRRKSSTLISLQQIEDYLIYHIPLQEYMGSGSTARAMWPFRVVYESKDNFAGSFAETPWRAYAEVAAGLYRNPSARKEITDLYYKS